MTKSYSYILLHNITFNLRVDVLRTYPVTESVPVEVNDCVVVIIDCPVDIIFAGRVPARGDGLGMGFVCCGGKELGRLCVDLRVLWFERGVLRTPEAIKQCKHIISAKEDET